ncbi:MAG: hypothetical protein A3G52_04125 [Candidatus Taylorbacteria bacterium RIFCSPLOWO2_12_FULL_43_20]|uniref:Zinc finger DksA/TraR C4-type domain-containing protein n=1 Tax=Candidatus Taylorbacteria bacterium RIFCSPLOWO2_12_FULL_43_20 TaxID=1802332 RepID=A0A1G2P0N2_9BACT|nr:MAG: hypothetical protein A2825_00325 [Candidatus Taylorbacteria bacterium RIFCSPHIGHO2_01_FULL_43_120]OHA22575.1 MAG: hypothetical protein A3B98_02685 [Candidatus Taylorbacteria bacterium RIFCSPHIGHO2_02_FULL_43_55]OHA28609.1 MAG: hypothetical protein A3E92_01560 [Candidatus Taylorbacteria bacterium RIFCSPHIGHO2_12_FULL_42_34]OHA30523.1 MAG: hypothetical protein A3B09_00200 [Candidatus Taylorbacteria bacterium RIFCSPLOWO2_01_FULL_43_83]OHA38110.1 MAG: hypothetical protein A3H58_01015 [Candi
MKNQQNKEILEQELERLESELKTVGRANPKNPEDWEADTTSVDIDRADDNEVADKMESFGENTAIVAQLEIRHSEVKRALERIEEGTYGNCTVCGKEIEKERLVANPAAATCVEHMK